MCTTDNSATTLLRAVWKKIKLFPQNIVAKNSHCISESLASVCWYKSHNARVRKLCADIYIEFSFNYSERKIIAIFWCSLRGIQLSRFQNVHKSTLTYFFCSLFICQKKRGGTASIVGRNYCDNVQIAAKHNHYCNTRILNN